MSVASKSCVENGRPLSLDEYERYGRQMIQSGWGLPGQLRLRNARIAVVGAGGLGCPVLQYLAGAGVGTIDIFDHDIVSVSNLHRQVLHSIERVGMNKAVSAALAIKSLNPHVEAIAHEEAISQSTALILLRPAHIIVDCTDRPMTRYLLNDASVHLGVPLVSGAAIASVGQWAVYGGSAKGKKRACYRCLWPSLLPGSSGRCEDVGVWGVVTGLVGTGMAGEVLKLLLENEDTEPLLHLLHLGGNPLIRTVRMKPPSNKCAACGPEASITRDLHSVGYDEFCEGVMIDEVSGSGAGTPGERIDARELGDLIKSKHDDLVIVDTRPEVEFGIASIPESTNIPLPRVLASPLDIPHDKAIVFLCRQGNDSQLAAAAVRAALSSSLSEDTAQRVRDVRGGLRAWSRDVDPTFPKY